MSKKKSTQAELSPFEELEMLPTFPLEDAPRPRGDHAFWATQDVEAVDQASALVVEPIDKLSLDGSPPSHIRPTPFPLPPSLRWEDISTEQLPEVHDLLQTYYVGSDGGDWVMHYSLDHLRWAMPGDDAFFRLGVRDLESGALVGFIAAIPRQLGVYQQRAPMVEINFLCLHERLRSAGMAPLLIKEITRRVKIRNRWQGAIYTAGMMLPHVMASSRCFHRMLSVKKMLDIGFFQKNPRLSMKGMHKLYAVPKEPAIKGLRPMVRRDDSAVAQLLNAFLARYHIRYFFSKKTVGQQFRGPAGICHSYVVENSEGKITDFISFYQIEMTVLEGGTFQAAYALFNVAGSVTWPVLMSDALVLAKNAGCDVFNCTDVMENKHFLSDLKFHPGTGRLQYYLYNWRAPPTRAEGVGVVMI
jgi:glycylpeptide N-tetradecanoyltransferase